MQTEECLIYRGDDCNGIMAATFIQQRAYLILLELLFDITKFNSSLCNFCVISTTASRFLLGLQRIKTARYAFKKYHGSCSAPTYLRY